MLIQKCKKFLQNYIQIFLKYLFLFWFGGSAYVTIEVLFRGYSHWTMLLLSGIIFVIIGLLNEYFTWDYSIIKQACIGSIISTILEFITGIIVNIILKWNIWNYSNMFGNILGQICPLFTVLWFFISIIAIILDDLIRWKFFNEEKPHYVLFKTGE